ncbi:MAG TPA: AAA family ATPase [Nevskiaceae bacterium]|nr:AAA family ATPase [Nevskiaceae bacterium]
MTTLAAAVYLEHFHLREMPFSITPDPAYLYLSPRHQEALGHLLYGTGQYGGFVQLTGEVGTGKTTVVRALLTQKLAAVDVAMIHNPRQSEQEFVQSICDELGVAYERHDTTLKSLVDALNRHLLQSHAAGRRTVLIIDEAQNLAPEVLEQVRLLTNLETHKDKLLRIMLVGQPELAALLARPDLRQLAQRITARYHLTPLDSRETAEYVLHRLRHAGAQNELFDAQSLMEVYRRTRGIPRLINILCDRALLGAYAAGAMRVNARLVRAAASEAAGNLKPQRPLARFLVRTEKIWAALALLLAVALVWKSAHEADWVPAPPFVQPTVGQSLTLASSLSRPPVSAPAADAAGNPQLRQLLAAAQPLPVAMGRLIGLWDRRVRLSGDDNVCRELSSHKLECYRGHGSWNQLAQLNRPALITLRTPFGDERHVLLRGLSATHAVLETAGGTQKLPLALLDGLWTGDYLLLWRNDSGQTRVGPETRGEPVFWLARRLVQLGLLPASSSVNDRYDANLRNAVSKFQSAHGLPADGVADIATLIALSDGPRLEGSA